MAKHTYGFDMSHDEEDAKQIAVQKCKADGFLLLDSEFEVEVVHSEELDANNEFHVVIRSDREGHVMPIPTEVVPLEAEPKDA